MTHTTHSIDLELRREALRFSVRGARASVPMLWIAVAIVLLPARNWPGAWPAWLLGSLALASGLWRLAFMQRLQGLGLADARQIHRHEQQVQANAALSGLLWAVATLILLPHLSAEQFTLHIGVLLGAVAVASYYMSLIGRSFELIAVPATVPLVGLAIWMDSPIVWPVTAGSAVYLLAMLRATHHFRRTALEALRGRLEMAEANQALQSANSRLEAEAGSKARFLSTMGHEIRQPMSVARGALDLLAREPLSPAQHEWLALARRAHDDLSQALTSVLDHSRLEAGPLDSLPEPVALHALCRSVLDALTPAGQAKGLDLALHISPNVPEAVQVDPAWLRQILQHLLSNAIKFTERGRVTLRLALAPQSPMGLRFEVEDSGIGIGAADHERIFQPFRQLDPGPQRAHGGAGLGLSIARQLVERLGGRISVRSLPGQGSCFSFELMLPLAADAPAPDLPPPSAAGPTVLSGTVLVVEDDPGNRMVTVEMLQRCGLTVVQATDGLQALSALHRGGVDLVLMDGQMPSLDGYEATRQWREREQRLGTPRLPIVAVSANALPEDVRLARDCGMDEHLAKPFGMGELLSVVARQLRPRGPQTATAQ